MEPPASRIILPMGECKVYSDLDLYLGVQAINWTEIFNPGATFAVHFSGLNDTIRNSQYGAMKVKDAIVDAFTRKIFRVQMWTANRRTSVLMSG